MNSTEILPESAVTSASGVTWLDKTGVIVAVAKHHAIHTLEHAHENHKVNTALAQGIRRPFLIDMTEVSSMSHEARTFYAGPEPPKILTAVAILTNSTVGMVVANLFMSFSRPLIPTRLFTNYGEAMEWLQKYK